MRRGRFGTLFNVAIGFTLILAILLFERLGIKYGEKEVDLSILPEDQVMRIKEPIRQKSCLLIFDSDNTTSVPAKKMYDQILTDMRVPYDVLDLEEDGVEELEDRIENYQTIVIAMSDLEAFGEGILSVPRWVAEGGRALFGIPPFRSDIFAESWVS